MELNMLSHWISALLCTRLWPLYWSVASSELRGSTFHFQRLLDLLLSLRSVYESHAWTLFTLCSRSSIGQRQPEPKRVKVPPEA